jgi:hypothetical protein
MKTLYSIITAVAVLASITTGFAVCRIPDPHDGSGLISRHYPEPVPPDYDPEVRPRQPDYPESMPPDYDPQVRPEPTPWPGRGLHPLT